MSTAPDDLNQLDGWAEPDLRAVLEAIPDAIVVVDAAGRIVLTNAETSSAFGYADGELTGQDVDLLLPERHRRSHGEQRSRFQTMPLARSIGERTGLEALRKDGTEFPVAIALRPISTPRGMLVCAFVRDISEQRRIELSLYEKSIQVENAGRARDRFFAGMSHELRTPLNAIVGFTGTLLMRLPGPLTPDQETQLKTVQSSARQLVSLINELLDVAKLDADEMPVRREWVDVRLLAEEVAAALRPAAARKGLELGVAAASGAAMVSTDRQMLRQILRKLMENAVQFTDGGVVLVSAVGDGGAVQITVADTGPGILPDFLARLFEPFSHLDAGAVARGAGPGLGLHLCRKLAVLLGGTLGCVSEPGRGSNFILRLPGP